MYYGSSPVNPIYTQVLDLNTLEPKGEVLPCLNSDAASHGWERPGEHNEQPERRPYIEGAWMTQHNGKYYLQYATPGTEWNSYADGAYVSNSPQGPFTYLPNSPVSHKPTGFIGGAGHGCLFTDETGNYWKAATNSISVRHPFERRVSFYPAGFDSDGYLYTNTAWGDYPIYLPDSKEGHDDTTHLDGKTQRPRYRKRPRHDNEEPRPDWLRHSPGQDVQPVSGAGRQHITGHQLPEQGRAILFHHRIIQ